MLNRIVSFLIIGSGYSSQFCYSVIVIVNLVLHREFWRNTMIYTTSIYMYTKDELLAYM